MSQAAWGFIGVLTGAVISGGGRYFMQVRAERRETKIAKRLVADELQTVWINLTMLVTERTTPTFPWGVDTASTFLPTEVWDAHKVTLAASLPDKTWGDLALLTHACARLREIFPRDQPGRQLGPDEIERYRHMSATAATTYRDLTDGRAVDADP